MFLLTTKHHTVTCLVYSTEHHTHIGLHSQYSVFSTQSLQQSHTVTDGTESRSDSLATFAQVAAEFLQTLLVSGGSSFLKQGATDRQGGLPSRPSLSSLPFPSVRSRHLKSS